MEKLDRYHSPKEWYQANKKELKKYRGQWIAYTKEGIIAHHAHCKEMFAQIPDRSIDFVIERIYETEFIEPLKFLPIRFRNVKKHDWQPKYEVILKATHSSQINILVDSGADISLISRQLGESLGLTKLPEELILEGETVGGNVSYLLRNLEISINSHQFTAPFAWLQTDDCEEILLGREVVFDLFDIEFKQAEEKIIFKYRNK